MFRLTLGALARMVLTVVAHASEVARLGPIEIDTPWARATVGTARPGSAYVTFRNTGDLPEELVGSASRPRRARKCTRSPYEAGS